MAVVATIPLALADRPEALAALRGDLPRSRSTRGSIFATTGRQLWGGYASFSCARLSSSDAERDLRDSLETLGLWGVPAVRLLVAPSIAESLLEQGADAARRRAMLVIQSEQSDRRAARTA